MAIQTAGQRQTLAVAYGAAALWGALYTTVPASAAGTEVTGGSPAYARKALSWSGSNGVVTASATFDIPAGTTLLGGGVHSASTAGTYLDGAAVTSQAFASQGTYVLTFTSPQT